MSLLIIASVVGATVLATLALSKFGVFERVPAILVPITVFGGTYYYFGPWIAIISLVILLVLWVVVAFGAIMFAIRALIDSLINRQ